MSEKEMLDYLKPYEDAFGVHLWATSNGIEEGEDDYHFMDDLGICITVNPKQKIFDFSAMIDSVFRLTSGRLGQFDNKTRFEGLYYRFRDVVLKFKKG